MDALSNFARRVARHFQASLGASMVEAYKLGSLAHGGFSLVYSDIDIGLLLACAEPPAQMSEAIDAARILDAEYGKKLSVFWGNAEFGWGRLPVIDRLDLLDHGVPLLGGLAASFRRPTKEEIHREQLQSVERSWKSRLPELSQLTALEPRYRKPYIRAVLYAARLIYTWDNLRVDSNDRAVEYLHQVQPPGLSLRGMEMALTCRSGRCTAEEVFALRTDLNEQCERAIRYISARP
jgi:hypothetical protein